MSEEKLKSFQCENCGGTIKWNITQQRLECSACRTPFDAPGKEGDVQEHDYDDFPRRAASEVAFPEQMTVTCSTCGAQVTLEENKTATVCPMCGSSQVMESKQTAGVPPDGLIPFKIDKNDAQQRFRKWVTSRWFAPNKLKKTYQQGKLDGIYLPFWTFDADAQGRYVGRGGTEYEVEDSEGKTETKVRWTPVTGYVSNSYDDIQICASTGKVREVIGDILPYSTQDKCMPYDSAYLSGCSAERYSLPADQGLSEARDHIRHDLNNKAHSDILSRGYDRADVTSLDLELHNIRYKHVLLPAWVSAFAYSGKQYLYLINGETGKVSGKRPYSAPKIIAAIAAVIAVIVLFMALTGDDEDAASVYNELPVTAEVVQEGSAPSFDTDLTYDMDLGTQL